MLAGRCNLLYFTLILNEKEFLFQDEYLKEIVGLLIPFDERRRKL